MSGEIIPEQPVTKRIKNFSEVSLGFNKNQVIEEARRCPQCQDAPCVEACPLGVEIPDFIRAIRESEFDSAHKVIKKNNGFPAICGRICSAPCERECVLSEKRNPIQVRALERFVAEVGRGSKEKKSNGFLARVAVVGSGPAGLTVARELAIKDFHVTVFESLHQIGGTFVYGIPEFRLPKKVLNKEVEQLHRLGVNFERNCLVGRTWTIDDIFQKGYQSICLAYGAGIPKTAHLPGEDFAGVMSAEEFLLRANLMKGYLYPRYATPLCLGERVAVIGGGNAAADCARIVARLGKDVRLVFPKTEDDLKVRCDILRHLKEEGVQLSVLTRLVAVLGDEQNCVRGIKCIQMDFADPDKKGDWKIVSVRGSEFIIDVDTVIMAIGHKKNKYFLNEHLSLKMNKDQTLWTNKGTSMTSIPGVFVCGAMREGPGSFVHIMGEAKKVSEEIVQYLNQNCQVTKG